MSYVRSYQEILACIDSIDPAEYAQTRNHLSGAVTRLSPYITRGVITLPLIRDRLLVNHSAEDCAKLIQELAWREYFQNVWWEKNDAIFSDLRFPRADWHHQDLVSAIVNAHTGITVIDEAVKELYETGYMHNHARMWLASIACNLSYAHWHTMGKWLYFHLLDGDLAANFLSWQWVAGTSVNKRYTVNQELINACSDIQQADSILNFPRETMLELPTPEVLTSTEPFTHDTLYPDSEEVLSVSGAEVCIYTPWTLNPKWQSEQDDTRRILVIDPVWFDAYPVSELVLDFIVRQGQVVIPTLEVHYGRYEEIAGLDDAYSVRTIAHQTNTQWQVEFASNDTLFPTVTGYYQSFFKYWQAVQDLTSSK